MASDRHAQLALLEPFTGTWATTGTLYKDDGATVKIEGTDRYEWFAGSFFLIHHVHVTMGNEESRSLEIIGWDDPSGSFVMHYYDHEGGSGKMTASVRGSHWKFENERLRFEGAFSEDLRTISGTWENSKDGNSWKRMIDIRLERREPLHANL